MSDPWDSDPIIQSALPAATTGGDPWDMDPIVQTTADPSARPLTIHPNGGATGSWQEDPGFFARIGGGMLQDLKDKGTQANSFVDAVAAGLPFSDRLSAAAASATGIGGTAGDYAGNLEAERTAAAQRMQQNPALEIGGQLVGGSLLPLGAAADAIKGATLGARVIRGAAGGSGIGALYGASASQDLSKPVPTAISTGAGAAGGALLGGALPLAGAGAGALYRNIAGQAVPAVDGVGTPAQQYLMQSLQADGPAEVMQRIKDYGDPGMLVDYGPSLRGVGQGLVTKPGPQQSLITDALTNRNLGTNDRLGTVVDQSLGPAQSPQAYQGQINQQIDPVAQAQQQALRAAPPIDVSGALDRVNAAIQNVAPGSPEHTALTQAQRMLTEQYPPGTMVPTPMGTAPAPDSGPTQNAMRVYSARQALDDQINYTGGGLTPPSSAVRSQQGAYQGVRADLNQALRTQAPGYADATDQIAALARARQAVEDGTGALGSGPSALRPDDFSAQYAAMTPDQQAAYRVGMRSTVDSALGTRANDLVALKGITQGDNGWNAQKLATAYGQPAADRLNKAVDTESAFRDSYNKILQNSETARRTAMAKALADAEHEPFQIGHVHNLTAEGIAATAIAKPLNAVLRAFQPPVSNAARDIELARAVTMQGDARNAMLAQLLKADAVRQANASLGVPVERATTIAASISPAVLAAALREHRQRAQ